jgi:hypothetical protein
MKRSKHLVLIVMSVCVLALLSAPSWAEQRGASPKPIEKPVVPSGKTALKPLQQSLVSEVSSSLNICSSLQETITSIAKLAHQDLQKACHSAGGTQDHLTFPGTWELYYVSPLYKNYLQGCCSAQKSFSVQDQQNAGCANSDTVGQCMDKLVKHCISSFGKKEELKGKLMQSQDKAEEISALTKQLSEKLKLLINTMP